MQRVQVAALVSMRAVSVVKEHNPLIVLHLSQHLPTSPPMAQAKITVSQVRKASGMFGW